MEVIRIGMIGTFHDLRHNHTLETSRNLLDGLYGIDLKTYGSQCISHLLRRKAALDIILQPVIGNLHISCLLLPIHVIIRRNGNCLRRNGDKDTNLLSHFHRNTGVLPQGRP